MTLFRTLHSIYYEHVASSLCPGPFLWLGSMAKREMVEKTLRKAAESIGITQMKMDVIPINAHVIHTGKKDVIPINAECHVIHAGKNDAIPINTHVIHWEITSCKH